MVNAEISLKLLSLVFDSSSRQRGLMTRTEANEPKTSLTLPFKNLRKLSIDFAVDNFPGWLSKSTNSRWMLFDTVSELKLR